VARWSALSPLGRLGHPQDVARAAVFLASGESDYLTGDSLNVAGGMVMH
jgi:3-oxoacyl-[acyl-carrier protein] reductase